MISSTPAAFADHSEVTIIPDTGSGSATDDCVDIEYGCYVPGTAVVDLGGKVIFSNTDSAAHTFTAGNPRDGPSDVFESGFLAPGDSAEYIADTVGEFDYFCMVHPWMSGMLIVQEAEAAEEEVMEEVHEEESMVEEVMEEVHEEEVMEEVHEEEVMEEVHEEEVMEETTEEGGGCLIATAAFGSELAPQVQQLRELRDNTILQTESGTAFMAGFNQFYYSFSPVIADLERESPIFKEVVKLTLTPMLSSLSLLNYVDIDSEQDMLGYGISLIILNAGMYVGIPLLGILKVYQIRKN
jgi:plastocyanin